MRVVSAGFQILRESTKTRQIERIARVCYKSEDKIGEGTDKMMIENLLKRKHLAMLEHADSVFEVTPAVYTAFRDIVAVQTGEMDLLKGSHPKSYLRLTQAAVGRKKRYLVSGNFRAWYELMEYLHTDYLSTPHCIPKVIEDVLPYIDEANANVASEFLGYYGKDYDRKVSEAEDSGNIREITDFEELVPKERMVHERFTVLFTTDRGITHELVRMREASFAQESTRYVNYSKGKYGSEICVIRPFFFGEPAEPDSVEKTPYRVWEAACRMAEKQYMELTEMGVPAQKARNVLPHSTKVDIAMTANLEEWKHIFELRACDMTGAAHPQMKEIMVPLLKEVKGAYGFAFGKLKPAEIG